MPDRPPPKSNGGIVLHTDLTLLCAGREEDLARLFAFADIAACLAGRLDPLTAVVGVDETANLRRALAAHGVRAMTRAQPSAFPPPRTTRAVRDLVRSQLTPGPARREHDKFILPSGAELPTLPELLRRLDGPNRDRVAETWGLITGRPTGHEVADEVERALADGRRVQLVVATLDPVERSVLTYIRRHGPLVNAWEALAFSIPILENDDAIHEVRTPPGAALLRSLHERGLILSVNRHPAWQDASAFAFSTGMPDFVYVEPTILASLPESAPTAPIGWSASAAIRPLLAVLDVYRRTAAAGGLPLTKDRAPNRVALKRALGKLKPAEEAEAVFWLDRLVNLGLLADHDGQRSPQPEVRDAFLRLPIAAALRLLRNTYASSEAYEREAMYLERPGVARYAMFAWLNSLAEPLEVPDALNDLRERFLPWTGHATRVARPGYLGGRGWDRRSDLLLEYAEALLNGPLSWLGAAEMIREGSDTPKVMRGAALSDQTGESSPGPAFLIQPNFSILVYLDRVRPPDLNLLSQLKLESLDARTAVYRLDRGAVTALAEQGQDVDAFLDAIAARSSTPVAQNVRRSAHDWAESVARIELLVGCAALSGPGVTSLNIGAGRLAGDVLVFTDARPGFAGVPVHVTVSATGVGGPRVTLDDDNRFQPDGLDLPTRLLLEDVSVPDGAGRRIVPVLLANHPARRQLQRFFSSRIANLDSSRRALARAWLTPDVPATLDKVVILRHPEAAALAGLPQLAGLVAFVIAPDQVVIRPGLAERALAALQALGVPAGVLKDSSEPPR